MNTTPRTDPPRRISTRAFTIASFAIILLIACVVSFWASSHPDGLEFVAETNGFIGAAEDSATATSPFADYGAVFVDSPWLSLALAGAIGCLATFVLAWIIGAASRRRAGAEPARR
ncbi:PDGLE domain-containing protein [Microbacterium jiangjiandongii]|uniref:PDGLE domain-containing protein n=1 Tax=Microbacterium jiangjiandongii TaxID=3049071 RepID=UPI00214ABFCB|nr:PDGLE domain-containing protein [Microbacterium sp. zg.Y843]MCR2814339.1 PDGLE domain-containing protein [Microbacterium sp. zg.Y843]